MALQEPYAVRSKDSNDGRFALVGLGTQLMRQAVHTRKTYPWSAVVNCNPDFELLNLQNVSDDYCTVAAVLFDFDVL